MNRNWTRPQEPRPFLYFTDEMDSLGSIPRTGDNWREHITSPEPSDLAQPSRLTNDMLNRMYETLLEVANTENPTVDQLTTGLVMTREAHDRLMGYAVRPTTQEDEPEQAEIQGDQTEAGEPAAQAFF